MTMASAPRGIIDPVKTRTHSPDWKFAQKLSLQPAKKPVKPNVTGDSALAPAKSSARTA